MESSGEPSGYASAAQKVSGEVAPVIVAGEEEHVSERAGWDGSNVTPEEIQWLRDSRRIPDGVTCRLPSGEIQPEVQPGEHVVFMAHFQRGLGLPISDFLRTFLEKFELLPHHLPANAFVHLYCLATFAEAYVGVWPSLNLFAKYFQFRRQSIPDKDNPEKEMTQCGAATIMARTGGRFPRALTIDSCKGWIRTFFYVKNQDPAVDLIRLPHAFKIGPPTETMNWGYNPKDKVKHINLVHDRLAALLKMGLTADDLVRTFIKRRVLPLQKRTHKMCYMSGRLDPNRVSTVKLSKEEVLRRAKIITKTTMSADWIWGMKPYKRSRPCVPVRIRLA